jgi:hypothetical protein
VGVARADKWTKLTRLIADVGNVLRTRLKLSQHDAKSGSYWTGVDMSTNVGILLQRSSIFSAYIQIKNDNHTNGLQTKI